MVTVIMVPHQQGRASCYVYYLLGLYMQYVHKLFDIRLNRFLLVGAGNTAINFAVLNAAFIFLHSGKVTASILATSCAIIFSFIFNRSFVFRDRDHPAKKFIRFAAIAVAGTLLLQTSIYSTCTFILSRQGWITNGIVQINICNLIASLGVMVWNYNGYRLLVFKDKKQDYDLAEEADSGTT
jgi:putative flippase GtrA